MSEQTYIGTELLIFEKADKWKSYFSEFIFPFLGQNVLEVGAGIGATTKVLCIDSIKDWLCLEPDPTLVTQIEQKINNAELPACCRTTTGLITDLDKETLFDSIIYIDVLEHIEDDREELANAARHLVIGGKLIVLSPAYESLYSPFDQAIGHFRRYNLSSMSALTPDGCHITKLIYLDSVGVLLSFANRLMLQQSLPTDEQIQFWNNKIVPIAKIVDRLTHYKFGRSVFCIWEKQS